MHTDSSLLILSQLSSALRILTFCANSCKIVGLNFILCLVTSIIKISQFPFFPYFFWDPFLTAYIRYFCMFPAFCYVQIQIFCGRIQGKTWSMGPYAGVDYNPTLCSLQSRLQHIYHGQPNPWVDLNPMPVATLPNARVDLNPMPESTLTLCQSRP